ncbi:SMI1/KNR4 family protein [Kitasatospora sp. NPDC056327]|uniref:SMI1/KNR4 family protein n=1 Tax=Kitasatospora sp. NPDC056327 TaxID=3345785 RepID=UPI0035D79A9C
METEQADPRDLAVIRAALGRSGDGSGGGSGTDGGGAPALGWAAVRAFEAEHGVVLPEPYRTSVAEIADGSRSGPPDHGLLALAELPGDWGADRPERDLGRPFPLTSPWVWEDDPAPAEEIGPVLEQVFGHGSIVLGTDGCGSYWHLVVTGPHRGHVWYINGEGAIPFGAEHGFTTAAPGFAGWVEHWAAGRPWFDAGA